jgi:PAS domain S-box-containing protein
MRKHADIRDDNGKPGRCGHQQPRLPDNPIVECNAAFEALTGYERDEIIGRNCRFLRGPGTEPDLTEELRLGIREGRPVLVEIINYKKDGTRSATR